jgi:hypothetical protein
MATKVKSLHVVSGDYAEDCNVDAGNFTLKARFVSKVWGATLWPLHALAAVPRGKSRPPFYEVSRK